MRARILVVDDSMDYQELAASMFGQQHDVVSAMTLAQASRQLSKQSFDLILLDVNLPDGDGFSFFVTLKAEGHTRSIPVIFLTGQGDAPHEVMGFSLGAEDYISKPADVPRLRARIEARLRRIGEQREREMTLMKGNLKLMVAQQRAAVVRDGKETPVELTPLEFKLLFHLLRHEEQVFSREQLLGAVWGQAATDVFDRTVDMHVSNVRRKIAGSDYGIKAVHGVGYRMARRGSAAE